MLIPQITKILYATDLTKNSAYAFFYAIDMAKKHNASIVILHVIQPINPRVYSEGGVGVEEMMREGKKRERAMDIEVITKNIQDFCRKTEAQVGSPCVQLVSGILLPSGDAVDEILKAADDGDCDAIVLGTHGKGLLRHAFLGSVAVSVLERTRKPVFIIPLPSDKTDIEWNKI
jgi:nucleotide-binding universal stress UspA family protein